MTLSLRRANCAFTLGSQQKTVPYARLQLDPQTLINLYADLRLRLTHNSINFTTKIWKISKFKNVMHPEKRHPYPKFYCDSMKEETKNWSLTFFQALKINVFCTLSSVVIQLNVPLLASFILSSKKMAAKFSLLFLRLSWKMPDDSSLSHTLEKMAAFAFFIQSFQQKNCGKISPLFLRFELKWFWPDRLLSLSHTSEKNPMSPFNLWLWKKMRDSKKSENLLSQCRADVQIRKKKSSEPPTENSLGFQFGSVTTIENH